MGPAANCQPCNHTLPVCTCWKSGVCGPRSNNPGLGTNAPSFSIAEDTPRVSPRVGSGPLSRRPRPPSLLGSRRLASRPLLVPSASCCPLGGARRCCRMSDMMMDDAVAAGGEMRWGRYVAFLARGGLYLRGDLEPWLRRTASRSVGTERREGSGNAGVVSLCYLLSAGRRELESHTSPFEQQTTFFSHSKTGEPGKHKPVISHFDSPASRPSDKLPKLSFPVRETNPSGDWFSYTSSRPHPSPFLVPTVTTSVSTACGV